MDLDNLQQNMNTRVVFREPRGMIRWLQLFFAILAFSTVVNFDTSIGINITCPAVNGTAVTSEVKLAIKYPFGFNGVNVSNPCANHQATSIPVPLGGSPEFFVMTGVIAFLYAASSLVIYLFYSSTYDSNPIVPVADLIAAAILCLFWFIASVSLSSGATLLKSTSNYELIEQTLCSAQFKAAGGVCTQTSIASWKSLNTGLVSGYTSFFLWAVGMWFVYKETHFHTPRL